MKTNLFALTGGRRPLGVEFPCDLTVALMQREPVATDEYPRLLLTRTRGTLYDLNLVQQPTVLLGQSIVLKISNVFWLR